MIKKYVSREEFENQFNGDITEKLLIDKNPETGKSYVYYYEPGDELLVVGNKPAKNVDYQITFKGVTLYNLTYIGVL